MMYTELTIKAMKIAYNAHHGQVDKSGVPYVFHPYHVAEQMTSEEEVCTALLHDVVEDTDVTLDDLRRDFPDSIVNAVRLLTHEKGQDYFEYVRAIKSDPIAKAVKLADIAHNSDISRITSDPNFSPEKIEQLRKKYAKARAILLKDNFS